MSRLQQTLAALVPVTAIGTLGIALVAGQQPPAAVYTAEQAGAGRAAYQANCAGCHLADLAGRNEAPQLAGNSKTETSPRSGPSHALFFVPFVCFVCCVVGLS